MPGSPRRDDGGTIPAGARRPCPACTTEFVPVGRAIYCSTACRKRAFRARRGRQAVPVVPAGTFRRDHTVYECPDCGERQAGQQWCAACVRPARAVGLGGACPHCGEPVTVAELDLAVAERR
jgi:hypothetical protein